MTYLGLDYLFSKFPKLSVHVLKRGLIIYLCVLDKFTAKVLLKYVKCIKAVDTTQETKLGTDEMVIERVKYSDRVRYLALLRMLRNKKKKTETSLSRSFLGIYILKGNQFISITPAKYKLQHVKFYAVYKKNLIYFTQDYFDSVFRLAASALRLPLCF